MDNVNNEKDTMEEREPVEEVDGERYNKFYKYCVVDIILYAVLAVVFLVQPVFWAFKDIYMCLSSVINESKFVYVFIAIVLYVALTVLITIRRR